MHACNMYMSYCVSAYMYMLLCVVPAHVMLWWPHSQDSPAEAEQLMVRLTRGASRQQ